MRTDEPDVVPTLAEEVRSSLALLAFLGVLCGASLVLLVVLSGRG